MTPLYFFPGKTIKECTREFLLASEVANALRDCLDNAQHFRDRVMISHAQYGPSGSSGTLVSAVPNDSIPRPGYHEKEQRWVNLESYWLGIFTEDPPTSGELERENQLPGYEVTLGDGNVWNCPKIRKPLKINGDGVMHLPREFGLDKKGQVTSEPLPEYQAAWDASGVAWNFLSTGAYFDITTAVSLASLFLNLNYRVSLQECLILKLINEQNLEPIFVAACDREFCEQVIEELKKNI